MKRNVVKKEEKIIGGCLTVVWVALMVLSASLIISVLSRAESAAESAAETAAVPVPGISAGAAILMNAEDGTVIYEYNADEKMHPASTTKIMTALVTLEICEELGIGLDSEIIVPEEAEGVEGSSLYLRAGERLTLEELLYGLMLQSGNDAAAALAAAMGGTSEQFVERMNETAKELGCGESHFMNPHGLHDKEHYTTARNLAVITKRALQYSEFREIVAAREWNCQDPERNFVNKNKTVFQYEGGDGVKIGFTKASGRTLVASATRDGVQLIAVVLNDGNWFQDAYSLLDYGFRRLREKE